MKKLLIILTLAIITQAEAYEFQFKPFFWQTKDSRGQTLAQAVGKIYVGKVRVDVKTGRCYYFQPRHNAVDEEYEIDHCIVEYNQAKLYSQADRLNGIDIKGRIWIEGTSYRTRPVGGQWGRWQDSQMFSSVIWGNKTGLSFRKERGQFIFTLDNNLTRIHDKPNLNNRAEQEDFQQVQQPQKPVKGYVEIKESASGKTAYYEEQY